MSIVKTKILDLIENTGITPDQVQLDVIDKLQSIAEQLSQNPLPSLDSLVRPSSAKKNSKKSIFNFFSKKASNQTNLASDASSSNSNNIKGMYIWGDVGRGKTWLMDFFYQSLNQKNTQRIHFHEFMLLIHKEFQDLPTQPDPLDIIGENMAQKYRLICIDEFHVMDIADAVILHGLLRALFKYGVTIIMTSNRFPDELYKNGSLRERFLPAIELIKQHMHVFHLNTGKDYRKQREQSEDVFFIPHTQENNQEIMQKLASLFFKYSGVDEFSTKPIKIFSREIEVVKEAKDCIWFTFDTLCRGARSSSDYLQIAKNYRVVILSEIPVLFEGEEGPARRFLNLVDSFYDQHLYLILSSAVEIEDMYQGDLLQFEFERALSRLHEMQSHSWWQGTVQ